MNPLNPPLSQRTVNGMTITVYPQLTHIERNGFKEKYIGYTQAEAIRLFRNKYPVKKRIHENK